MDGHKSSGSTSRPLFKVRGSLITDDLSIRIHPLAHEIRNTQLSNCQSSIANIPWFHEAGSHIHQINNESTQCLILLQERLLLPLKFSCCLGLAGLRYSDLVRHPQMSHSNNAPSQHCNVAGVDGRLSLTPSYDCHL